MKKYLFIIILLIGVNCFSQRMSSWDTKKEWSLLMRATDKGKYKRMEKLLNKGVNDLNFKYPINSLNIAIRNHDTIALKILLSTNLYNFTNCGNLVISSSYYGNADVLKLLLKYKFPIINDELYGLSPLFIAVQFSEYNLIKLLLDNGVNVNEGTPNQNFTPLMRAAEFGRLDIIELLLSYGADKTIKSKNGDTALSEMKYIDTTKVSLEDRLKIEALLK